jgi:hypothetical protein
MARKDQILAVMLFGHGAFGVIWTFLIASAHGYPSNFLCSNLALAMLGVVAGTGCFKGNRWAAYLGLIFWGIQVLQVLTPTFQFSFTLGVNLILAAGWNDWGRLGVNVFALTMLVWLARRIESMDGPFRRPSPAG